MIEAELPDGTVLEFEEGTPPEVVQRVVKQRLGVKPQESQEASGGMMDAIKQGAGDLAAGAIRGAGSIGATILSPLDAAARKLNNGKPVSVGGYNVLGIDRRTGMDEGLRSMGANTDSLAFQGGKLATEIAGTAGAGGALAKGVSMVPGAATRAAPLIQALRSGGFNAGGVTGKAGLALRGVGGAGAGAASSALVNPEDAGLGAVIGGALPVLGRGVAVGSRAVGRSMQPQTNKAADKLLGLTGMGRNEAISALRQQGPQLIPGYQKTVPQIFQNEELSQLQRTLKTANSQAISQAEKVQQAQFLQALERVAPMRADVFDAANRAGTAVQNFALPARAAASARVSGAFNAVDPFGETKVYLPIEKMQKAADQYLGPGTFGTGQKSAQAIKTAQEVGTMELPGVAALKTSSMPKDLDLEQAVRKAGGIKLGRSGLGGELKSLGIKESGTTGLVNNKSGREADLLADEMYRRGFIPDADADTLIETLRNGGGRGVYAHDASNSTFAAMAESAMGDAPVAESVAKAVPFQTVQNLRSSIGEAAEQAAAKGANKEAAALRGMVASIDEKINQVAGGAAGPDEFFPDDIAKQYRDALDMHAAKMARFDTGPQASMFRKGGDNQASIQGAEIPGKFYNAGMSQADDVKAFKRLVGDRAGLMEELKSFATTQGASMADAQGNLGAKFIKWAQSRSGANQELFKPNELATIKEVAKAVENQIRTEGLGRVTGSDTAQKLAAMRSNRILDSRFVDIAANRVPFVGSVTGPMLQGLRNTATKTRDDALASLLASPEDLAVALESPAQRSALVNALKNYSVKASRAAPVVIPGLSAE
jgi:hypothetical protein